MSKTSKSEYKRLKTLWYQKIKDAGFKDIEHSDGSINSARPHAMRTKDQVYLDSVQEYYNMCSCFLAEYEFPKELDRVIWEYHTEGLVPSEIVKALKAAGLKKGETQIKVRIRKYTKLMKAKYLSV